MWVGVLGSKKRNHLKEDISMQEQERKKECKQDTDIKRKDRMEKYQ